MKGVVPLDKENHSDFCFDKADKSADTYLFKVGSFIFSVQKFRTEKKERMKTFLVMIHFFIG